MPLLVLDGFSGPLERLLTLARADAVDLARLSLPALVDQLAAALHGAAPLEQKAQWLVMASWLVLLRSRLLLPADAPAHTAAEAEADALRAHLLARHPVQALAGWLDRRPQLGCDVFARGQPARPGTPVAFDHEVDVVAFLWASLALFDDDAHGVDTAAVYCPPALDLHAVADARARILLHLAEAPEGEPFERLLPAAPGRAGTAAHHALRVRSAWASTLVASLELAKQGDVTLAQEDKFGTIHVSPATPPHAVGY